MQTQAPTMCCNPVTGICVPATVNANVQTSAAASQAAGAAGSLDLDLSSTTRNIVVPASVAAGGQTITVGNTLRPVTADTPLTPAELMALHQVLTTNVQSIVLGPDGNAIGGSLSLLSAVAQQLGNLVVPAGVTAVHDFAGSQNFNIAGNLTNAGSLYALSSNSAVSAAAFSAANIFNQPGALISSVLPAGGLAGFSSAASSLSLSLIASHDIVNLGTIASSGNLALSAGGSIVNNATITAAQNASLMSSIGNVVNSGLIAAAAGNINVIIQQAQNVLINNAGGQLEALNGQINIGAPGLTETVGLSVTGGDLLSKELNIFASAGAVNLDVGKVTGPINISADEAHVTTRGSGLTLGNICLTGDPTFFAIDVNDDVNIAGVISTGGPAVAIVAARDVNIAANSTIDTSGANGGDISIIAGAKATSNGALSGTNDTTTTLEVTGASVSGGDINIGSGVVIKANGLNAGNVSLIAFADANNNRGNVIMDSTASIEARDGGQGLATVQVIGGGNSPGITLGAIDTTSTQGQGQGAILVSASMPVVTGGINCSQTPCVQILDGAIINGGTFKDGAQSTGNIKVAGPLSAGQTLGLTSGTGGLTVDAALSGSNIDLTAIGGTIDLNAVATAFGGFLNAVNVFADTFNVGVNGGINIPSSGPALNITSNTVKNDGLILGFTGMTFSSTNGASPVTLSGAGTLQAFSKINFTNIGSALSVQQGAISAAIDASTLTLKQTSFSVTQGGLNFAGPLATDGGAASFITLIAPGNIVVPTISAAGAAGVNGGTINVTAADLFVFAVLASGASVDAQGGTGQGSGGSINITTTSANTFVVGAAPGPNGTAGDILADGFNGGSIQLNLNSDLTVSAGSFLTANGKINAGGTVFVQSNNNPFVVTVNGLMAASNTNITNGQVGISAGPLGSLSLAGTGTIQGGGQVKVGNVAPGTLLFVSPGVLSLTVSPNLNFVGSVLNNLGVGIGAPGSPVLVAFAPPTFLPTGGQSPSGGEAILKIATDQTPVEKPPESYAKMAGKPDGMSAMDKAIPAVVVTEDNFDSAFVSTHGNEATQIGEGTNNDVFVLDKGSVFFAPTNRTIKVKVQEGVISIEPNCQVLVVETGNDCGVYNMHDTYTGSVKVVTGKKEIVMKPGMQVVLTRKQQSSFEDVNPAPRIAYRNVRSEYVGDGIKAFAADFSIPSAMARVQPLRKILISKRPKDKRIAYQLLKNAVVIAATSPVSEPYRSR